MEENILEAPTTSSIDSILAQVIAGHTDRYAELVRRYDKYLYKIGRSYGFAHQDTEDLMQDCFVKAYLHLKDFHHQAAFKTWLVQIMLHECFHKKQRAAKQLEIYTPEQPEATLTTIASKQRTVEEIVNNHELHENIEAAIVQLPEKYRSVFVLRELNDLSVNETAQSLGISATNVKARLNRAKSMLREQLNRTYNPEELFAFNLIYCDALVARVMEAIAQLNSGSAANSQNLD
ncbi:MAG: sigma-70 family RNA polymerase sigma factor [Bacteroidetes bacterium]|nr:sigma-70 family RNA polymerase sigma factor [Bacteroidota bacterium]